MAKRFLYMIALAFVLQLSWGVASAYCMHESGKASQHFGHHQHQHQSAKADGGDEDSSLPKKTATHPDCAACVHSSLGLFAWTADVLQLSLHSHELYPPPPQQPEPYLGMPERPQWTVAA
jgi:hypothetical protein